MCRGMVQPAVYCQIFKMKLNVLCSVIFLIILDGLSLVSAGSNKRAKNSGQIKFVLARGAQLSTLRMQDSDWLNELSKFKGMKIYVHGFSASCSGCRFRKMHEAYKTHMEDHAVICVDWSPLAVTPAKVDGIERQINFTQVVENVEVVGKRVARFLRFLLKKNAITNLDNVHLIGFSFGAQIVGVAGHKLGGKVGRITGLDPGSKGFSIDTPLARRLDKSDGKYVDIIHTSAGRIGSSFVSGHADFFPNGGVDQPGCKVPGTENAFNAMCSHSMATEYFIKSIANPSYATACECQSWEGFVEKMCDCAKNTIPFGEHSMPGTSGIYYLSIPEEEGERANYC